MCTAQATISCGCARSQHDWDCREELLCPGELHAVVDLLPHGQAVVDALVLAKRGALSPVEEVKGDLRTHTEPASEWAKKNEGFTLSL